MPRAFLFTHRRYNPPQTTQASQQLLLTKQVCSPCITTEDQIKSPSVNKNNTSLLDSVDTSNGVIGTPVSLSTKSALQSTKSALQSTKSALQSTKSTLQSWPEELFNLTQLAEVSVAAAAGRLYIRSDHGSHSAPSSPLQPISRSPSPASCSPSSPEGSDGVRVACCPECGKSYSTPSNLARHRQTHRSPADTKARICPHCSKVYVSLPAFAMHVRTHGQGCKCHYCGKAFSRPWLLQGHIRTHTGEKPFSCVQCGKCFADKSNLRAHTQTHSNLKPWRCTRCSKSFALKSYLYKHEEASCMRIRIGRHIIAQRKSRTPSLTSSPDSYTLEGKEIQENKQSP